MCGAIEVLRDATASLNGRQRIEEHAGRFQKKYKYKNWAILNFAMNKDLILPDNVKINDRIYNFTWI
jgi:hypothetical protein